MMTARCLVVCILTGLLGLAAFADVHVVPVPDDLIRRADVLGAQRDIDGAIALLQRASDRYPTNTRVTLALGGWQEARLLSLVGTPDLPAEERRALLRQTLDEPARRDDVRVLMETWGRGVLYATETREIRRRAADLTSQEAPVTLGEYGPLALPGAPEAFSYAMTEPDFAAGNAVGKGLITTQPLPVGSRYLRDPKYGANPKYANDPLYGGWTFQHALWAYDYDHADRAWRLRFRVFWQDAPGHDAERADTARQTARLLLRVAGIVRHATGLSPRFSPDGAVNIWLAEKGEIGAETYSEHIYVLRVGDARSPDEWVRELMHEYGHAVLQPVGGYAEPEWGANGRLGERLFLRWLLDNPDPHVDSWPWLAAMDGIDQRETRVDRLMRRFAALGPENPLLQGVDTTAMDGFVGFALYLDCTQGAPFLTQVLSKMTNPAYSGPNGFVETLTTLERAELAGDHPAMTLRLRHLPSDLPLWVYLTDGSWRGSWDRLDGGAMTLKVEVDGTACTVDPDGGFTSPPLTEGWHRVTRSVEVGIPSFLALTLVRQ